jgi:hypothetical protein
MDLIGGSITGRVFAIGVLVALIALPGCTFLQELSTGDQPAASDATSQPAATASPEPAATPVEDGPMSTGEAEPIPDVPGGIPHEAGDQVEIPTGVIVFQGLFADGEQLVARFQLRSGSLPDDARLLAPDGGIVGLDLQGSVLESAPFGDSSDPPPPSATITLVVDDRLVVFEVGRANSAWISRSAAESPESGLRAASHAG